MAIVFCIIALTVPALLIYLCRKVAFLRSIGTVVLCYLLGIIVGNIGLLPASISAVQASMSDIAVAIALPFLLFSIDVRKWLKLTTKGMLCMLLATISILTVSFGAFLAIRASEPHAWQLAGMAIGMYTGGTPNAAAIKLALDVPSDTYLVFLTYDTVLSLIYIFLMSSVARPFFLHYMRPFERPAAVAGEAALPDGQDESLEAYVGILRPSVLRGLGLALVLSLAIVAISQLLAGMVPATAKTAVSILTITTLGIAASFVPRIRRIPRTFSAGMYVIYVFCFVVASMTRFDSLVHINWPILGFVAVCIFGTVLLHSLLSRLFNIDVDTFIITSVSAVCSPPFVPPVAAALKNKAIVVSGLTTGIVGYAIGNYLGVSFAYLFRSIP